MADGRLRRPARCADWSSARDLPFRPLRLYGLRLRAHRPVPRVPAGAAAHQLAVWPCPARHPRKPQPHAGDRSAEPRAHPQDLYDRGHDRRHCRRSAGAHNEHGLARRARFPALSRGLDHPGARRRRPDLWRPRRRHHFHGGTRSILRHRAPVLVFLDRHAARYCGDAAAQWHPRWRGCAYPARARPHAVTLPALATLGLEKRFGSLVVASDINLTIPHGVRYAIGALLVTVVMLLPNGILGGAAALTRRGRGLTP